MVICNPPEGSPAYEAGFAEGDRVFNFGKCVSAADLGPVIDGLLETKVPCVVLDAEDRYVRKFITPRQWNPDAPKSVLGVTCARAPLSPGRHPCLTRPNLDAVCGRYNTLIDPLLQFGVDDRVKCLLMFEEECTHDHSHVHGPNCDHGEPSLSPRSTSTPTSTLPPGLSFRQITTASRATATHTTTRTRMHTRTRTTIRRMRTGTCTAQTATTVSQAFSPRSTSHIHAHAEHEHADHDGEPCHGHSHTHSHSEWVDGVVTMLHYIDYDGGPVHPYQVQMDNDMLIYVPEGDPMSEKILPSDAPRVEFEHQHVHGPNCDHDHDGGHGHSHEHSHEGDHAHSHGHEHSGGK